MDADARHRNVLTGTTFSLFPASPHLKIANPGLIDPSQTINSYINRMEPGRYGTAVLYSMADADINHIRTSCQCRSSFPSSDPGQL